MTANTDSGIMELDKLIHSFEFENQQYVKMIEKENQLIMSLESQIQEKIQQSLRLEEEISRFDEDTKRLHRLYTNNRDSIENMKNTINVLSDHEVALSRQLEVTRAKTEENRKFYNTQIANYTSVKDDYMKKYTSFPLAVELEQKKLELTSAQRKLEDIESVKQDLKTRITIKENELDSKMMTRIVIKIAKSKLALYRLEKNIHECLAEKTDLLEKLKDIRTSKQSKQNKPCREDDDSEDRLNMETGEISEENIGDCERQRTSDDVEEFSNMSITDDHQKIFTDDGQEYTSRCEADGLYVGSSEDRFSASEPLHTFLEGEHPAMSVDTRNVSAMLGHESGNNQPTFPSGDSTSENEDLNNPLVSGYHDGNMIVGDQMPVSIATKINSKPLKNTKSEDHTSISILSVSNKSSLLSRMKTPLRETKDCQQVVQHAEQVEQGSMVPKLGDQQVLQHRQNYKFTAQTFQPFGQTTPETTASDNNESPMAPSLRFPRLSVPKPPRVLPPPVSRVKPRPIELQKLPESSTEIKRPPPPPSYMLKDFRQKLKLFLPKPPLHLSHQQNQYSALQNPSELTPAVTEEGHPGLDPRSDHFNNTQVQQFQVSAASALTVVSKKVSGTALSAYQQNPSNASKESSKGKQSTELQGTVTSQTGSAEHSTEITDVEVPIDGRHSENSKALFKFNLKGSQATGDDTKSPKEKSNRSSNCGKYVSSPGSGSFFFSSLFGNFGKNSNEEDNSNENDDEPAPTSIFSLFNASQNPGNGNGGDDSTDAGSFFTFGKFTDETGSPSTDGAPCNLLNLFNKSQNSDSNHEFAITLQAEENEASTFKLGDGEIRKGSYFSYGRRCESDEEGEKPLFNLF